MNKLANHILIIIVIFVFFTHACVGFTAPETAVSPSQLSPDDLKTPTVLRSAEPSPQPAVISLSNSPSDGLDAGVRAFLADMHNYNAIGLAELKKSLEENPSLFLLDVREMKEVAASGYIDGAVLIPLRELADNTDKLPSFDTPIISYCHSGWRCAIAITVLEVLGWQDVKCLAENSFSGWVQAGYPVVSGIPEDAPILNAVQPNPETLAAVALVLKNIPVSNGGIQANDLFKRLQQDTGMILIDVREDEELSAFGVIKSPNVLHIPLRELSEQKAKLPTDKSAEIVVYCSTGYRSAIAMTILWLYGYSDVQGLKGGFDFWSKSGFPVAKDAAP